MTKRWPLLSILMSFSILTTVLVLTNRRSLCIDSKVVERIDRVSKQNQETVYKCSVNRTVPYSSFFSENAIVLNHRIGLIEKFLEAIAPFKTHLQLVITEQQPWLYKIESPRIFIGTELLKSEGHLERAIIKSWLRDYQGKRLPDVSLSSEVLADFLTYIATGNVVMTDDRVGYKTKLNGSSWPQVVKSKEAYCRSPWKLSEHYEFCTNDSEMNSEMAAQYSSRPLITSSLIEAYQSLSLLERYKITQDLAKLVQFANPILEIQNISEKSSQLPVDSVLKLASDSTKQTVSALNSISETLKNKMSQELLKSGYSISMTDIPFDFLFVIQDKIDINSAEFNQLYDLANRDKKLKIAIKDSSHLWLLPAKSPIVIKSLDNIRADRTILEQCGDFTFEYVMDYEKITDKLFVIDACAKKVKNYASYVRDGVEGFARNNKGVDFIQFHIPSLAMKKSQISRAEKVIEMIQKRDIMSPTFQSLGWQEIRWNDNISAYHPRAYVDAIEWFRIQ